jgi:CheY-like chemotaxis protein
VVLMDMRLPVMDGAEADRGMIYRRTRLMVGDSNVT